VIGVLLVTHGGLGQELLRCAEGIIGKQSGVRILGLDGTEGPAAFEKKIQAVLEEMKNPAGVLVLADMMGGTPCNTALRQVRDARWTFELVTGVNLPMLVSVLMRRQSMALSALAQKVVDDAPRTILRPMEGLRKAWKPEGS
jgi:mannose PTS system EIIA component